MKGNQNLPNKQATSNNITSKQLQFPFGSQSSSRENGDTSRHRSPSKSYTNSKTYYGYNFFKAPIRSGSSYPRLPKCQKKPNYNSNNTYSTSSRQKSPNYNRDGNRSRQLFSRNRHRNVRNYINSLFDQGQTDHTMSHKENTETQKVSEEQLWEQQLNHLLLELNQDPHDEYFNCQEEGNNLTKNIFFLHRVRI